MDQRIGPDGIGVQLNGSNNTVTLIAGEIQHTVGTLDSFRNALVPRHGPLYVHLFKLTGGGDDERR